MNWFGTAMNILEAGLTIAKLNKMEKASEHLEQYYDLKVKLYEQNKKPVYVSGMDQNGDYRNDDIVNDCLSRLRILAEVFAGSVKSERIPPTMPG